MKDKLLELMKNEDLRPGQLAEMLGVNPASISHILAGRNKPGFDLLQKILNRFPNINPDWLILDKGSMYRDDTAHDATSSDMTDKQSDITTPQGINSRPSVGRSSEVSTAATSVGVDLFSNMAKGHGRVRKIVILYEDGTFESFSPMQ